MSTSSGEMAAPAPGGEQGVVPQAPAPQGLFFRRSSGLVRDIGVSGAFGLNLGWINIGIGIGIFGIVFSLFPGVNLFWALLIGGLLTGVIGFAYAQLTVSMPRSGGDYVFDSRVFHPVVGAWVGIAFLIVTLYAMATFGPLYATTFLPFSFGTLGSVLHISALTSLASDVTTQAGQLISSFAIIGIAVAMTLGGAKLAARAAFWFMLAGLLAIAVVIGELLFHSPSSFEHAFNAASANPHAYNGILAQAHAHGWKTGSTFSGTLSAIPYAFLIVGGFWYTAYTGGEVKQAARTQSLSMTLAFAFGLAVIVLAWVSMQHAATHSFVQASAYLQGAAPTVYSKLTSISAITAQQYAVIVAGDPVTKCIMALGYIALIFAPSIMGILALSRTLFAFSFDRLLPQSIARVSGARHNPIVALCVTTVVVVALTALVIYDQGISGAFRNITVIDAVIALVACVAAAVLPFRRRKLFEASPKVLGGTWLGVPRIVPVCTIAAAFLAVVTYLTLTKGQYSGGYTTTSIISLAVFGLAGIVVYLVARLIRRSRGIDIALAMEELPPD